MENLFMFIVGYLIPVGIITGMAYANVIGDYDPCGAYGQREALGAAIIFAMIFSILSYLGVLIVYLMTAMAHYGWVIPGVNTPYLKNVK